MNCGTNNEPIRPTQSRVQRKKKLLHESQWKKEKDKSLNPVKINNSVQRFLKTVLKSAFRIDSIVENKISNILIFFENVGEGVVVITVTDSFDSL